MPLKLQQGSMGLGLDDFVMDVWDVDTSVDVISVDVFLPTGFFLTIEVDRFATLSEIKEEVWDLAVDTPLFGPLRDMEGYGFQCVSLASGEREDLEDEDRRLCDVRPFQALLKLVQKEGRRDQEHILASRLQNLAGRGRRDSKKETCVEVLDFSRNMRAFCEEVTSQIKLDTWERRVLREYPACLESSPDLPPYLTGKLHDGNVMLSINVDHQTSSINVDHQASESITFKISVPPSLDADALMGSIISKKGQSVGIRPEEQKKYALKICGLQEYLIGPSPLSQYKYIQDSLSCDKVPELILITADTIILESPKILGSPDSRSSLERSASRSVSAEGSACLKRKKLATESAWWIQDPLALTIHSAHKCPNEKIKIAVQCGVFYGDEMLCGAEHTEEAAIEGEQCVWEERLQFELRLCNVPRAAKLCLCAYEVSATQKNGRYRKYGDTYACPFYWVNTPVFDHKGVLNSSTLTLDMWLYSREADDYSSLMVKPLGPWCSNPERDQPCITLSFAQYHPSAVLVFPSLPEILKHAESISGSAVAAPVNGTPHASKSHLEQLRQICEKDSLYQLHEQEKELMWFLRGDCRQLLPDALPKLLRCLKWNDRDDIAQMTALLQEWPPLSPYKALELLDYAYPDPGVRGFAVRCLRAIRDEELALYLLQLVQALKHEAYLENELVKFLLERALQNRHNGHRLFWLLRSEIHFPEVTVKFGLILEVYCRSVPSHLDALVKQVEALNRLKVANNLVQMEVNIKKEGREKLKAHIQDLLSKGPVRSLFKNLQNPLDPRFKFGRMRIEKCKFLDSKMKPLWLAFENTDTWAKDVFIIFKNGDDLRQDMLTLQMIRIMDRLWKDEGLDFRMIPYHCLATGNKVGLIEVVPDADTIANIQKEKGFTPTSAFRKGSLLSWLKDHNPDDISLNKAAMEFTLSCAGYSVATYVLGVADRHSDNIMVKTNGQLFHVDFGHILGKFKEKFGLRRERVPFVLTHDFVHIITKGQTQKAQEFTQFQQYCEKAFMILRKKGPLVISLFAMMLSTGIPELSSEKDLDYLRETLVLDMTELEALRHFRSKFDEALKNSWKTSVNWMAHNWAKDNKMCD